jgi:hypothetical protein
MRTINTAGNAEDVRSTLKCSIDQLTTSDLTEAINDEMQNKKRTSVIYMLTNARRKKLKSIINK